MRYPSLRTLLIVPLMLVHAAAQSDTLLDIYEMALKNDPVLQAAQANYRAGQEAEVQGRSALLPQVGAQASYGETNLEQRASRTFSFGGVNIPSNTNQDLNGESEYYHLTLSQNIFNVPAWFSFKQGKELTLQAEAQFAADQQDLVLRTVEAYTNVLRALDNLKSSQAEEAALQRQLEQTQQRFEVGLIAITDVYEARAGYDLAVVNRLTDEGVVGVAYEALSVLTGQPHNNVWLLDEKFPVVDPQPVTAEEWEDLALKGNFDLKTAEYAAEAARQASQSRRSAHLPTITGNLNWQDTQDDSRDHDNVLNQNLHNSADLEGTSITIDINMPLYAGGYISSQRRQSYELYNAARDTYTSVMRNTIQATRSLHIAVLTDVQRVLARKQSIISAQSALDATTAGYEVGTRNVVDVLNAQQVLYGAIRDYANTRFDYVMRSIRLRKQAGMLGPEDIQALNRWLVEPAAATKGSP